MEYWLICITAFFASGLTLVSGFGLGTILLPVFALFFPIEIAITLTAIVHFLNNIFKFVLVKEFIVKDIVIKFGIPALIFAFIGAQILKRITFSEVIYTYTLSSKTFEVTILKVVIGVLLLFFALFEIIPFFKNLKFSKKLLPLGGALSGFFGGLSGHQGALRSAFLIKSNLSKEAFVATGVVIACLIDITRLFVYSDTFFNHSNALNYGLLVAATGSAFLGAYIGKKIITKITISIVQQIVSFVLIIFSVLMISGLI